jgi:hypothetical protein
VKRWHWIALVALELALVWAVLPFAYQAYLWRNPNMVAPLLLVLIVAPPGLVLWYLVLRAASRAFWRAMVSRYGGPEPLRIPRRPDR